MKITNFEQLQVYLNKFKYEMPYLKNLAVFNAVKDIEMTDAEIFEYIKKANYITDNYIDIGQSIIKERNYDSKQTAYLLDIIYRLSATRTYIYSKESLETLLDLFLEHNIPQQEIQHIIVGAKKLSGLDDSNESNKSSELLRSLNEHNFEINTKLFSDISFSYSNFGSGYKNRENNHTHTMVKKCYEAIKYHNKAIDSSLQAITNENAQTIVAFSNIFKSILKLGDKKTNEKLFAEDIVERLLDKYSKNTNIVIDKEVDTNFRDFIYYMIRKIGYSSRDNFSHDELKELLSNTISLVYKADANKAFACRNILKNYLYQLTLQAAKESDLESTANLSNISSKSIIMKDPSILLKSSTKLYESTQLLLGNNISDTYYYILTDMENPNINYTRNKTTIAQFINDLPYLQITGITPKKNSEILNNNPELLSSLNIDNMRKSINSIVNTLYSAHNLGNVDETPLKDKVIKLNQIGYNCNQLFHADNIEYIFNSRTQRLLNNQEMSYSSFLTESIYSLSHLFTPETIQHIIQHNFNSLINSKELHYEIAKLKHQYIDELEFKQQLLKYLLPEDNTEKKTSINNEAEKDLYELNIYAKTLPTIKFNAGEDSLIGILYSINSGNYETPSMQILKLRRKVNNISEYLKQITLSNNENKLNETKSQLEELLFKLYGRNDKIKGKIFGLNEKSLTYHKAKRENTLDNSNIIISQRYKERINQVDSEIESLNLEKTAIKELTNFFELQINSIDKRLQEIQSPEYNIISSIRYLLDKLSTMTDQPITLDTIYALQNDPTTKGVANSILRLNSQYTYTTGESLLNKLLKDTENIPQAQKE